MTNDEILVDVDEVLGDFQTPALDIMEEVTGRRYQLEDFKEWDMFATLSKEELKLVLDRIKLPGYALNLQPTPGSQEFIQELSKLGKVYIVTTPFNSPTWVGERTEWLWKHFGIPSKRVVHTGAKYLVRGRALLDDKPEHIDNWSARHPGELALLWHNPTTRHLDHPHRVHTWADVLAKVERHLCSK